jgi:putative membrane protein
VTEPERDLEQARRTDMAAERTWLAWWRTALAASAGALAVGRFAPDLLNVAAWPYVILGCGYAALAIALLVTGAARQRRYEADARAGVQTPLPFLAVGAFTGGGILLALMTVVLVIAHV